MKSPGLIFAFVVAAVTLSAKTVSAGPYVDAVLVDNPSGYWRLEEGAGTAVDSSPTVGGANSGTYVGTINTMTGAIPAESSNIAYHSTNQNDYIRISDTLSNAFTDNAMSTSEFTLETWLNPDLDDSPVGQSLGRGLFHGQGGQFISQNGQFIISGVDNGSGGVQNTAIAGITSGTWTHVVLTAELDGSGGTDLTLYFNGAVAAAHNTGTGVAADNSGEDIVIGTLPFGDPGEGEDFYDELRQGFRGGIDEVAIYPYVLPESRILAHCQASGPGCTAPQPGVWRVNSSGRWQDPSN
jgi:hypothetical protein